MTKRSAIQRQHGVVALRMASGRVCVIYPELCSAPWWVGAGSGRAVEGRASEDWRRAGQSTTPSLWASHSGASQARNMHERPQNSAYERAHRSGLEHHLHSTGVAARAVMGWLSVPADGRCMRGGTSPSWLAGPSRCKRPAWGTQPAIGW